MKIGALLPRSTFHPLLQHDFLQGIQAYLLYKGIGAEFITANIGYGTDDEQLLVQAEKLLITEQVDLLIVYADQTSVSKIAALAKPLNRLLLVVHNGAKYQHEWEPHPIVLSNTLNNVIQCRLTGGYAAGISPTAAVCTSFYDGGYSHSHAMLQPYMDLGGAIQYNFVSQYTIKTFNSAPLLNFLNEHQQVQTLLALFNGELAHCFLQQLQQANITQPLEIIASPMMLDETITGIHGALKLPFRVSGYVPWISTLNNNANQLFKNQFKIYTGRDANLPGMHGWDTGMIIGHIYNTSNSHYFRAKDILAALQQVTLDSPRGPLQMDTATHHMIAPAWLVQTNEDFEPSVIQGNDNTMQVWQEIVNEKRDGIATGWINTYLCA